MVMHRRPAGSILTMPLLAFFMGMRMVAWAQVPPSTALPGGSASGRQDGSLQVPAEVPMLQFRVRSAFSLTPSMVQTLQAKNGEQSSASSAQAAPRTSQAQSAPHDPLPVQIPWGEALTRALPFAAPLDVRLVGKNVVALLQIIPMNLKVSVVELMVQGQIWVKMPDESMSYKTTLNSMNVALGSRLLFYPLGMDSRNGAPIAVEIRVDRPPQQTAPPVIP